MCWKVFRNVCLKRDFFLFLLFRFKEYLLYHIISYIIYDILLYHILYMISFVRFKQTCMVPNMIYIFFLRLLNRRYDQINKQELMCQLPEVDIERSAEM